MLVPMSETSTVVLQLVSMAASRNTSPCGRHEHTQAKMQHLERLSHRACKLTCAWSETPSKESDTLSSAPHRPHEVGGNTSGEPACRRPPQKERAHTEHKPTIGGAGGPGEARSPAMRARGTFERQRGESLGMRHTGEVVPCCRHCAHNRTPRAPIAPARTPLERCSRAFGAPLAILENNLSATRAPLGRRACAARAPLRAPPLVHRSCAGDSTCPASPARISSAARLYRLRRDLSSSVAVANGDVTPGDVGARRQQGDPRHTVGVRQRQCVDAHGSGPPPAKRDSAPPSGEQGGIPLPQMRRGIGRHCGTRRKR